MKYTEQADYDSPRSLSNNGNISRKFLFMKNDEKKLNAEEEQACDCCAFVVLVFVFIVLPYAAYFCWIWDASNSFNCACYEVFWGPCNIFRTPPILWIWMTALGLVVAFAVAVVIAIAWQIAWGSCRLVWWMIVKGWVALQARKEGE